MKLTKRLTQQHTRIGLAAVLLLTLNLQLSTAQAQATAFTYQGRLDSGGGPTSGSYDFTFTMFNDTTGGTDFGTVTTNGTFVTNGLFTVTLDFGSSPYISGAAQWLEIAVRTNGAATFSTLAPRQPLHSTPYAYYAYAVNASSLIGQVTDANLAATFVAPHSFTHPDSSFTGNGSGLTALNASQLTSGSVPDARLSANVALRAGGNALTGNQTVMSGNVGIGTTTPQQPLDVVANSSAGLLRLQNTSASGYSVVNVHDNTGAGVGGYGYANPGTAWNAGNSYIASTAPFVFMMGGGLNESVRITPAGNVGIGVSNPAEKLSIDGNILLTREFSRTIGVGMEPDNTTTGRSLTITAGSASSSGIPFQAWPGGDLILQAGNGFNASFPLLDGGDVIIRSGANWINGTDNGGDIAFQTGGANNSFVERMRVLENGNVGIGTTTPLYKLAVRTGTDQNLHIRPGTDLGGTSGIAIQSANDANTANGQLTLSGSSILLMNGNVGIGTASPNQAKLVVNGSSPFNIPTPNNYLDGFSFGNNAGAGPWPLSIYANENVAALRFFAFSDARIKLVEGRSDSAHDLATILGIQVTDYTYIDKIGKGTGKQKKVIAQQVEEIYPQAVSKITDVVPDIYQKAAQKDGWVQLATDLKVGERVKLIGEKEEGIHEVLEVRKDAFRTAFKPATEKVFVYGREVKDFRSVDYEAISMLNVSATQELARKLDAQESELSDLRSEVARLRGERKTLAQTVSDMEGRFTRLEKAVNTPATRTVNDVNASAEVK